MATPEKTNTPGFRISDFGLQPCLSPSVSLPPVKNPHPIALSCISWSGARVFPHPHLDFGLRISGLGLPAYRRLASARDWGNDKPCVAQVTHTRGYARF